MRGAQAGQKVLINGAGGGSSASLNQLAKLAGAIVTGVDNAHKLDFMTALGADHVLDYRETDFAGGPKRWRRPPIPLSLTAFAGGTDAM